MKSLKLFNCVVAKEINNKTPYISDLGYIITPLALHKKEEIIEYYKNYVLDGNDLNKSFYKNWDYITSLSSEEQLIHTITHYLSTYGTDFTGDIYIPESVLNIPEVTEPLMFKLINGISRTDLIEKCFSLLNSGVALKRETIDDIFSLLTEELEFVFPKNTQFKNKEANIILADNFGIYPNNPTEFLRYVIYKTTNSSLLIKDNEHISLIKLSSFNPNILFNQYGLDKLATIFNRFKPLFLAYKTKCPKIINKISKLSKVKHVPLEVNLMNNLRNVILTNVHTEFLDKTPIFNILKGFDYLQRKCRGQNDFVYKIRNGKSYYNIGDNSKNFNSKILFDNYTFLFNYLRGRLNHLTGKNIYIPSHIKYGIPYSEKQYLDNIPCGTKITLKEMLLGIYWENSWGAYDLDLSAINENGRIGWGVYQDNNSSKILYSGDITNAPNGATEYMYFKEGNADSSMVKVNGYNVIQNTYSYKIILAKTDNKDTYNKDYIINPNNVICQFSMNNIDCNNKEVCFGYVYNNDNSQELYIFNRITSNRIVSSIKKDELTANINSVQYSLTLNDLLSYVGVNILSDKPTEDIEYIDLSIEKLEKDTLINLICQ